jgi:hypothetical protein
MTSAQTDPDIQQAILTSLNNWRFSDDIEFHIPFSLKMAVGQQQDIGWQLFLEGWISYEWEYAQQAYYEFLNLHRTGKRWAAALHSLKNYGMLHGTYGSIEMVYCIVKPTQHLMQCFFQLTGEYGLCLPPINQFYPQLWINIYLLFHSRPY